MSRVIKFRAWDKGFNRMLMGVGVHPHICCIHDNYRKGEIGSYTISPEFVSYELMQYTGLTDRNGVEIYEGDIVTADDILCVVEWQKAEWTAAWSSVVRGAGRQWRHPQLGFRVHEVIGNIYENSELLEAKP